MTETVDEAGGWSMLEPFDARAVFFIRHAARIQAWAALEQDVQEHAEQFLVGLAKDLQRLGGLPGLTEPGVVLEGSLERKYPMVQLRRASWSSDEISVALQWRAKNVTFEGPRSPYVGVRVEGRWHDEPRLRKSVMERFLGHRSAVGGGSDRFWPAYRTLPIPDHLVHDDHIDLAGYRNHLLAEFLAEWLAVADLVDATIREVNG
jgi:hypothetical protein